MLELWSKARFTQDLYTMVIPIINSQICIVWNKLCDEIAKDWSNKQPGSRPGRETANNLLDRQLAPTKRDVGPRLSCEKGLCFC